jgi:ubiquinone/menaquinone biosynthesis C-methylase UbiE
MLPRVLEPEVMDSAEEARDYDAMDHAQVNRVFVADFLTFFAPGNERVLDVGTGTAQIPIELCRANPSVRVVAVDLAEHMLAVGRDNVQQARLAQRIRLERIDAKRLSWPDASFAAVISNSIVHHIPEPEQVIAEMVRVTRAGGALFVRDLLRPGSDADVEHLVRTHAGQANAHQQKMFADSLRAALTLEEIQMLVRFAGFDPASVALTSDRHWTWAARKPLAA